MGDQVVVLIGTLAGAALGYLFQSLSTARQRRYEVADRARRERLEAAAALPAALVAYRHAQIARRMNRLTSGERSEPLSREVRAARAQAWSALYQLDLLVDDDQVQGAAYALMNQIKALKEISDPARLDDAGTEVHWAIQEFIKLARTRLAFDEARTGGSGRRTG